MRYTAQPSAYTPVRKTAPIITKTVKTWPDGASHQLQDCIDSTNWEIFEHADLEVFTDTVLCYIKNCTDIVKVEKHIWVYPNQKPWMTRDPGQHGDPGPAAAKRKEHRLWIG